GSQVRELNQQLTQLGFGNFPANPSRTYGSVTAQVVKEFQAHYKLPQTGIADKVTRDKIKEVLNPPYRNGDRGLAIVQLKKDLTQLGFGTFPTIPALPFGNITSRVVKEFQTTFGLKESGYADQTALDKLYEILTSDYRITPSASHARE